MKKFSKKDIPAKRPSRPFNKPAKGKANAENDRPGRKPSGSFNKSEKSKVKAENNTPNKRASKPFNKPPGNKANRENDTSGRKPSRPFNKPLKSRIKVNRPVENDLVRLNKLLANAGICSRREADELIASGAVSVNGKAVTRLGTKVKLTDVIKLGGQSIKREKPVYLLLNKPKDYITTSDDPQQRKTVMHLIKNACKERIYPVGRLDRNTTGLLLFTNDGELAKKLTHPKHNIRKVYHVFTDKNVTKADLRKMVSGVELEDGIMKADSAEYVGDALDKKQVGIELHSGKNRVIRRIFESLGYRVKKLDRVAMGGLTKKNLPRGKWRLLSDKEVGMLKMLR